MGVGMDAAAGGGLVRAVGLVLLLLVVPGVASAQGRFNGQETVGQFRDWPEAMQLGYVLGVRSNNAMLGLTCDRPTTNGEAIAALKYDSRFALGDSLPKAMIALELRSGCRWPEAAR